MNTGMVTEERKKVTTMIKRKGTITAMAIMSTGKNMSMERKERLTATLMPQVTAMDKDLRGMSMNTIMSSV